MDKEFILKYLRPEHLKGIETLEEIAEVSGLDYVKVMYLNHETLRGYIPCLMSNKKLLSTVVRENYERMSVKELSDRTGLRRNQLKKLIKELQKG